MSRHVFTRFGLAIAVAVAISVTSEKRTEAAPITYFNDYSSSLNLGPGGSIISGAGAPSVVLQSGGTNLTTGQYARGNQGTPDPDGINLDLGQLALLSDGASIDFSLNIGYGLTQASEDWQGTVNIGIYDGDPTSGGTLIDETGAQSYSTIYPAVWNHSGTLTLGGDTSANLYAQVSFLRLASSTAFSQVHWDNLSFAQSGVVPEPTSGVLVFTALTGAVFFRLRRHQRSQ